MRGTSAWGNNPVEALGGGLWVGGPPLAWVNTYSVLVARCRHGRFDLVHGQLGGGWNPTKRVKSRPTPLSTTPDAELQSPRALTLCDGSSHQPPPLPTPRKVGRSTCISRLSPSGVTELVGVD
jgi:hypothetical protein